MDFRIGDDTITVNVPTWAVLEARVRERFARRSGFALATINLDHVVKLRNSERFRAIYQAQDLVVADGNPIVWLSWLAGRPVALIPGSEAILPLSRIAAGQGVTVALFGSSAAVLEAAAEYLEREVRDLDVVCRIAPPMGFDPSGQQAESMLREIAASGARLCFVALGAPKQETFAATGRRIAPEVGFASIGAGLDFFAGTQKRAPMWMRRLALEWVWRMMSDPRRLALRYLKCGLILPELTIRALLLRFSERRN
ncbi:WecB/TagA/CpsF family glycosyltransferase [Maliponia aquimaris]|uniref:Putative N-acetylmannosaminyltransferase n=1 Tax=Maliponia aquimaris TaxID=1673631 RepID=A0A238JM57_9RHOB|nr:WecB/TagA/CpsF family glycosyltransferase [Maliponia aquimaris]SMX31731.1 Putative N-acetylmannosaminyltransferase [Maliponia aquimaris]